MKAHPTSNQRRLNEIPEEESYVFRCILCGFEPQPRKLEFIIYLPKLKDHIVAEGKPDLLSRGSQVLPYYLLSLHLYWNYLEGRAYIMQIQPGRSVCIRCIM